MYGEYSAAQMTGWTGQMPPPGRMNPVGSHVSTLSSLTDHPTLPDAEATRPNQVPSYGGIAQPSFASQYTDAPARITHGPVNVEIPFIPSSTYESRGTAFPAEPSFIDSKPRRSHTYTLTESEITESISPSQGVAGSTVIVHLRTGFDLEADRPKFAVMFGARKCDATLQKVEQDDEFYHYALSVEVPPFPLTNSFDPTMMLKLQMEDRNGQLQTQINAGRFTFNDMPQYQASPEIARLKRKHSNDYTDDQEYPSHVSKRPNSLRFPAKPRSMSGTYSAASVSPLPARSSLSATYGYASGYDITKQAGYAPQLAQQSLYAVPSGSGITQSEMKPPQMSPGLQAYSQYTSLGQNARSPAALAATPTRSTIQSSPSTLPTPVLVRATTLPQSASTSSGQPFNPYLMYPTKAVLKIEGDLDTMVDGWTQEERDAQRRLVEFKRTQSGSTITTSFTPITLETRQQRSICVSCIYWEEKDECFITSVDTIYLLEQLVNVRFTVEEKNRIRRNLEGFRPLTVSKAKSDSEDFFKVIMGFPNPKPRNIEKDVKVFPWKILAHALKKIISKYVRSLTHAMLTNRLTNIDCELLFNSWCRLTPRGILELRPASHFTDHRRCSSQHFATIGFQLGSFGSVYTKHALYESFAESENVSRHRWISRPQPLDCAARTHGAGSESVVDHLPSPGTAIHNRAQSRTRTLGLRLSTKPFRSRCARGCTIYADATLRRNTRVEPNLSR